MVASDHPSRGILATELITLRTTIRPHAPEIQLDLDVRDSSLHLMDDSPKPRLDYLHRTDPFWDEAVKSQQTINRRSTKTQTGRSFGEYEERKAPSHWSSSRAPRAIRFQDPTNCLWEAGRPHVQNLQRIPAQLGTQRRSWTSVVSHLQQQEGWCMARVADLDALQLRIITRDLPASDASSPPGSVRTAQPSPPSSAPSSPDTEQEPMLPPEFEMEASRGTFTIRTCYDSFVVFTQLLGHLSEDMFPAPAAVPSSVTSVASPPPADGSPPIPELGLASLGPLRDPTSLPSGETVPASSNPALKDFRPSPGYFGGDTSPLVDREVKPLDGPSLETRFREFGGSKSDHEEAGEDDEESEEDLDRLVQQFKSGATRGSSPYSPSHPPPAAATESSGPLTPFSGNPNYFSSEPVIRKTSRDPPAFRPPVYPERYRDVGGSLDSESELEGDAGLWRSKPTFVEDFVPLPDQDQITLVSLLGSVVLPPTKVHPFFSLLLHFASILFCFRKLLERPWNLRRAL